MAPRRRPACVSAEGQCRPPKSTNLASPGPIVLHRPRTLFLMKQSLLLLVCACSLVVGSAATAADRVALVVGCGKYRGESISQLETPPNDARRTAATLRQNPLGFEVIESLDATRV